MKRLLKPCVIAASLLASAGSFAATSSGQAQYNAQLRKKIQKISLQTQALQREVKVLQADLRQHKHKKHKHYVNGSHRTGHPQLPHYATIFRHPVTVTTSPFMGLRSAYNSSDLLKQMSTMNEDLSLLKQRQILENQLKAEGYSLSRPILEISGGVEGQALHSDGFGGSTGSVNLSTAELDLNAVASRWANAFISIDFDGSPAVTGSRVPNSRIYLKRGFVTIGDLNVLPLYFSIGQMYVPFGRYASSLVSAPLTLSMARVRVRVALLGLSTGPFYASLYGYTGNQTTGGRSIFKQGGANLGFKDKLDNGSYDVGIGFISNIADSEGMQNNGITQPSPPLAAGVFGGFGESTTVAGTPVPNFNDLRNRVSAGDVHGELTLGPVTFIGEYIAALRRFNPMDMSFNGSGAKPKALHTEVDYLFHVHGKPVTIGAAYGQSWQALALNLPRKSYWAVVSTSLWKDTVEAIEFRHDKNYASGTVATGGTSGGAGVPVPAGTGSTRNTVIGQIGVYF